MITIKLACFIRSNLSPFNGLVVGGNTPTRAFFYNIFDTIRATLTGEFFKGAKVWLRERKKKQAAVSAPLRNDDARGRLRLLVRAGRNPGFFIMEIINMISLRINDSSGRSGVWNSRSRGQPDVC